MINGMIEKSDLENKYVFWDIDGTLAAYRFNGHVADPEGTDSRKKRNRLMAYQ